MNADLVEEGKAKAAGIISILIGLTAFINLVCGFIYLGKGGPDGSGVWTGFGLAVIAVLGIIIWIKRNKTVMIFYLVMCILWFIVCIVQVIIALIAWLIWHVIRRVLEENCYVRGDTCHCDGENDVPIKVHNCDDVKVIESCFLAILLMSAFAAILTLAGSILGCITTCCARSQQTGGVVVVQQPVGVMQPYPGQMMMVQQSNVTGYPANPQPYPPGVPPQVPAGQMPPPDYPEPYPQKS